METFSGRKFGASQQAQPVQPQPHVQSDTLFSDDLLEVIMAVSEGPIKGPVDGLKSVFLSDTAILDASGQPNIGPFEVNFFKGEAIPSQVKPRLGGAGSSTTVGVTLDSNLSVTRTGSHTNIDFVEVRLVINRLLYVDSQLGEFEHTALFRIEVKPHSGSLWNSVGSIPPNPISHPDPIVTSGSDWTQYYGMHLWSPISISAQRKIYVQDTAPTDVTDSNAIWFNSSLPNYPPKLWNGATWVTPSGLNYLTPGGDYPYWQWTENATTRRAYVGWLDVPPVYLSMYDLWVVPEDSHSNTDVEKYVWNGSTWANSLNWETPPSSSPGDFSVKGKTTSPYVKELRIPVSRINEPYDVRVTKLNAPNTANQFCDMAWESFQEISAEPFEFPNLAILQGVMRSSDQFSSVPTFTAELYGRIIKVPTNYNPVTKVHTGLWDGTFKLEYTDNIAWIVYDLATNNLYGISAYQPIVLDKYAVYEFGRHCDEHGFTYNELMKDPRSIDEALNYLCGIAGGRYVDLGNGFATILFDADNQPPVALFAPENTSDGVFEYSFTDITTRKNDITVSFINPALGWREDRRRVYDDGAIAQFGRIPEEFIAVGCIDETEAVKRARLRLVTALTEKAIVNFKTNRQGIYLSPFDIILIADEDSGFGISGRIKSKTDAHTLVLRDEVYFEAGFTYSLDIMLDDGTLFTTDLTTSEGTTLQLVTATALPSNLAPQATFSISCSNTVGTPKAYRITAIDEVEGDPDNVSISAVEINRTKWAYVDGDYTPITLNQTGVLESEVRPITNLFVTPQSSAPGQHDLKVTWDASETAQIQFYRILKTINGGEQTLVAETRDTNVTLYNVQLATYVFTVYTVGLANKVSIPVSVQHTVDAGIPNVLPPANLRLVGGSGPFEFDTPSPRFVWDASTDPYFDHYQLKVIDVTDDSVKSTIDIRPTEYTYEYATNATDFGGAASRTIKVELRAVSSQGSVSPALTITVSNPRPSPPSTVALSSNVFSLFIEWVIPTLVRDWAGAKVHASTTNGFTPSDANLVYEGDATTCRTSIAAGETKYVKVGFYDTFDRTVTYSSQFNLVGQGLNPGTVSYDTLTEDLQEYIDNNAGIDSVEVRVSELETQTYGSWMVKLQSQENTGGGDYYVISGFGLAQTGGGEVTSDFVVAADRFSIIPAYNSMAPVARTAVFQVGTLNGVASVGIRGDIILDGSIYANSIDVDDLSAINADLGTVTAGIAKSADDKFIIDLDNRTLTIYD